MEYSDVWPVVSPSPCGRGQGWGHKYQDRAQPITPLSIPPHKGEGTDLSRIYVLSINASETVAKNIKDNRAQAIFMQRPFIISTKPGKLVPIKPPSSMRTGCTVADPSTRKLMAMR